MEARSGCEARLVSGEGGLSSDSGGGKVPSFAVTGVAPNVSNRRGC